MQFMIERAEGRDQGAEGRGQGLTDRAEGNGQELWLWKAAFSRDNEQE